MKKKKIIIFIAILVLVVAIGTITLAKVNPDEWATATRVNSNGESMRMAKTIISAINLIGVLALIITIAVIGVKYIAGSAEERADYKRTMVPVLVGAFMLFSLTTIINLVYSVMHPNSATGGSGAASIKDYSDVQIAEMR